jgi:hypothetical protein
VNSNASVECEDKPVQPASPIQVDRQDAPKALGAAELKRAIEAAGKSFSSDELAFLALTSKVERPFVDRISYQLFRELESTVYTVAREFPLGDARIDLAVLQSSSVVVALEAKAMYSGDCVGRDRRQRSYPMLLDKDLRRFVTTYARPQIYCLLLATHPLSAPSPALGKVVKYPRLVRRAFDLLGTAEHIRETATAYLDSHIQQNTRLASSSIDAGKAFGVQVEILWWLYGPFMAPEQLSILRSGGD